MANLAPLKENEVTAHRAALDASLKDRVYEVLACLRDRLGVVSFNLALYLPPIAPAEEDWSGFPAIVHIVDRGDPRRPHQRHRRHGAVRRQRHLRRPLATGAPAEGYSGRMSLPSGRNAMASVDVVIPVYNEEHVLAQSIATLRELPARQPAAHLAHRHRRQRLDRRHARRRRTPGRRAHRRRPVPHPAEGTRPRPSRYLARQRGGRPHVHGRRPLDRHRLLPAARRRHRRGGLRRRHRLPPEEGRPDDALLPPRVHLPRLQPHDQGGFWHPASSTPSAASRRSAARPRTSSSR